MFNGMDVIEVFMPEEINRLAREKPKFTPGKQDIGRLMDFLPTLRIGPLATKNTDDYKILETWKKDLKARNIPFVVLRKNRQIVKLYKERGADAFIMAHYREGTL